MPAAFNRITGGFYVSTVIQGRDITVHLPREITLALHGLPECSASFVGRDAAMVELLDALAPLTGSGVQDRNGSVQDAVITAIGGLGGIGKTELAVQGARSALTAGWFPGGALFVDMFGYDDARRLSAGRALDGWLRAIGIPGDQIPPRTQDRARLFRSVLARFAEEGQRILLVIDNVSGVEQVRPLIPTDGETRAIVTSRRSLSSLDARLVDLDVLPTHEASDLLAKALRIRRPNDTRIQDDPVASARIVDLCAGLPLALKIVAARLADYRGQPLSALAAELADSSSRFDVLEVDDLAVRAAFATSYQHLGQQSGRVFRLMSLNPGPDISTDATAAMTQLPVASARRILRELQRTSLIEYGAGPDRWRMHDLVRAYATDLCQASGPQPHALVALLSYYLRRTQAASEFIGASTPPVRAEFQHRRQAADWLESESGNLIAAGLLAAVLKDSEPMGIARQLTAALASYLDSSRQFSAGVAVATAELAAARSQENRAAEGAAHNHRGVALRRMRQFDEALTAHDAAARIFAQTGDRDGQAKTLGNLGVAYRQMHHLDQATSASTAAVEIFDEIGDPASAARARSYLSVALHEAGRYEEAAEAAREAVATLEALGDRDGLSAALGNLGVMLQSVGRHEDALAVHRRDLDLCRETGDRYSQGLVMGNISIDLRHLDRLDESVAAAQQAATIFRDTGDRHAEGMAYDALANALQVAGRYEEAVVTYRRALAIDTQDKHGEAVTLDNLAEALDHLLRFAEAVTARRRAIEIFREAGDRHRMARTLGSLGASLRDAGLITEAIAAYRQAADLFGDLGEVDNELAMKEGLEKARA